MNIQIAIITTLILLITLSGISQPIDINILKINGSIPIKIELEKLKSELQIDSITPIPDIMDISDADSLVYIGKSYFQLFTPNNVLYPNNNLCELATLFFSSQITSIDIGDISLNSQTTINIIKSLFSEECQSPQPIKIYGEAQTYQACGIRLKSPNGTLLDESMMLFFLNGKLMRISF